MQYGNKTDNKTFEQTIVFTMELNIIVLIMKTTSAILTRVLNTYLMPFFFAFKRVVVSFMIPGNERNNTEFVVPYFTFLYTVL